jgi:hypothetical protein
MDYSFREEPGMVFANIGGEVKACNDEARKALRAHTFAQMLFGAKKEYLTQSDYEEIEEEFSTR